MCVDFRVSAVLPAGGTGVRMGLDTPKQVCVNWRAFCGEYFSVFGFNLVRAHSTNNQRVLTSCRVYYLSCLCVYM